MGDRVHGVHIIPGYVQLRSVSAHLHSDLPLTPEGVRAMCSDACADHVSSRILIA